MNLQGEYVYVIEKSVKSGERIYKVGESLNILHTLSLYEKGIEQLLDSFVILFNFLYILTTKRFKRLLH